MLNISSHHISYRMTTHNASNIDISIVVPVYRSATILPQLVKQILAEMDRQHIAEQFELILVNDNSPDNSWDIITSLTEQYAFIKAISLRRNFGQHNAIMAGLNHVSGQFIVMMDDDLQHPPESIGSMLQALKDGADVCYTNYIDRKHESWKKLGSQFNDWAASKLLNKPQGLYLSSFKAVRRDLIDEIITYDGPYAYIDGLILDLTSAITTVDIPHQARLDGEGNYHLFNSISLWMKMATSFSVLPLRFASLLGFTLAILSSILILIILVQKILHPEWPAGWASLLATVLFIGGVQTLCIGIIGEYLGRAYLKLNGKPQFSIRHIISNAQDSNEQTSYEHTSSHRVQPE